MSFGVGVYISALHSHLQRFFVLRKIEMCVSHLLALLEIWLVENSMSHAAKTKPVHNSDPQMSK